MKKKDLIAKMLNAQITGENFVDQPLDKYIYASLSQPPIEIIDKNNSDDELDYTVKCPNCGSYVNYGHETYMLSGHIYCSNKGCRESLVVKLEEKRNAEDK
jgi:hypothetical protein